ncbi:MAG: anion transporter [Candidatus Eisenbacteria bacterium]|nr:anion transporter [Candidatus Eisenbacteria bacterium]
MFTPDVIALVVFALTYAVLGFGALPPLRIDRTGAALVGATAMVACRALRPGDAIAAVDFQTLALLFGMMIVVAHLRLSGFFAWVGARTLRLGRTPARTLALVVILSAVLSAFFVNDTACILLTPFALETAAALGMSAVPFLLAVAMGANAGSVATLVGNPQNMLVGSFSGISYTRFALVLAPVAVLSILATIAILRFAFRRELQAAGTARGTMVEAAAGTATAMAAATTGANTITARLPGGRIRHQAILRKALIVTGLLLVALLGGINPGVAAMSAGAILLITRRIRPERVWVHVDWGLLAMFAGLFVVVRGIEVTGWMERGLALIPSSARESLIALSAVTAALSNVVSNVPAVLLLRGWPAHFANPEAAWLTLAMASTLAGNLTLVGSVANLIVVEQARARAPIGFFAYARVGVPLALITLAMGTAWVAWVCR